MPVLIALIELAGNNSRDSAPGRKITSRILTGVADRLSSPGTDETGELTQINSWLGNSIGKLLDGKKTAFGFAGMLATVLIPIVLPESGAAILEAIAPGADGKEQIAECISELLFSLFAALTGWGVLGKTEKWTNELATR
ncbi:MAG: hypothetical protein ACR2O0_14595 [Rhizobiaceae bacterium]